VANQAIYIHPPDICPNFLPFCPKVTHQKKYHQLLRMASPKKVYPRGQKRTSHAMAHLGTLGIYYAWHARHLLPLGGYLTRGPHVPHVPHVAHIRWLIMMRARSSFSTVLDANMAYGAHVATRAEAKMAHVAQFGL